MKMKEIGPGGAPFNSAMQTDSTFSLKLFSIKQITEVLNQFLIFTARNEVVAK